MHKERSRAAAYINDKARTVIANVGLYLMLALDVTFLVLTLLAGYYVGLLVITVILLVLELAAVLSLLPVPLLQIGIVSRNIAHAVIFALMPLLELAYGISLARYGMGFAVYGLFTVARAALWATTFFFSRIGAGSGSGIIVALFFVIFPLAAAGAAFEFPLDSRPLRFEYKQATQYHAEGYVVTDMTDGMRDNVRIPATYNGKPVVGIDTGSRNVRYMRHLTLPESVTYISIQADHLDVLEVKAEHVRIDSLICPSLDTLQFDSQTNLPDGLADRYLQGTEVLFCRNLLKEAVNHPDFRNFRDNISPIVASDEGYIMQYTDCALPESGEIDDFEFSVTYTQGNTMFKLEEPDLSGQGYAFIGWYNSRNYETRTSLIAGDTPRTKVYAKFLKLYDVYLYDENSVATESTLKYHNESPEFVLPTPTKEGYAFCGWFPLTVSAQPGREVKSVPSGSKGNLGYYPVFKKLYYITYHTDGGAATQNLPTTYHEWSETIVFHTDGAQKDGYAFMGWYEDEDFTNPVYTIVSYRGENVDIYLKFNKLYTVRLATLGGEAEWTEREYHKESGVIGLPDNVTRTGYKFEGWYDNSDYNGSPVRYFAAEARQYHSTFYAKWTPIEYYIRYQFSEYSDNYAEGPAFTYDGHANYLGSNPFGERRGYTFGGWKLGDDLYEEGAQVTKNYSTVEAEVIDAVAVWNPITYTLRYSAGADDAVGEMADMQVTYGSSFALAMCGFTREGYVFDHWVLRGSVYYPGIYHMATSTDVDGDVLTVTAVWRKAETE